MANERKHDFRCSGKTVGSKYRLLMTGEIERGNKNAGAEVLAAMDRMPEGSELEFHLRDFYGGDVYEGLTIYHAAKDIGATVFVDGVVASMATIIMCAGAKVIATKRSKGMTHRPIGGVVGTSDVMKDTAVRLDEAEKELGEILAERTGLSTEDAIKQMMPAGKDVWFTAVQMKALGLIDEVVPGTNTRTVPMADARKLRDANDILNHFAAVYDGEVEEEEQPSPERAKTKAMNKEITAKLDLAEGADEAAVGGAIEGLKAKLAAAEQKLKDQAKADDDAAETEVVALVDAALKEDRITKVQAEGLKASAKESPKVALSMAKHTLGAMPAHTPLHGKLNVAKPGAKSLADLVASRADWPYEKWAKEDSKMLARLRDEAPELFTQVQQVLA